MQARTPTTPTAPPAPPIVTPPLDPPTICEPSETLLTFEILFDAKPGDVGFFLSADGQLGNGIWNFGAETFSSFTQFQRINSFSVCIARSAVYSFMVTDSSADGLVAPLSVTSNVYGRWKLTYDSRLIVDYDGDCSQVNGLAGELTSCGEYCSCTFQLSDSSTTGDCESVCSE